MSKPTDGGMKPPEREFFVHRITRVEIFEVTEQELESLEAAFGEESRSIAFFSSTVSVFATCFIGWITTGKSLPSVTHAILAGITLASFFSRPMVCFDLVSSAAKTTVHYQPNW